MAKINRQAAVAATMLRADVLGQFLQHVKADNVAFINFEFADVLGRLKCVTVPASELQRSLSGGMWIDGSSLEGFARTAEIDLYLVPDPSTYAKLPAGVADHVAPGNFGDPAPGLGIARLICDVAHPSGAWFEGAPRHVLRRAVEAAANLGYTYEVASELEFFLLDARTHKPAAKPPGGSAYFDLSVDREASARHAIVAALHEMGIRVDMSHHEVAPSQHELDLSSADALRAADAIVTARYVIKAIANRFDLCASFMPKPFFGMFGNGLHVHQSLRRLSDGANALADGGDTRYRLSSTGYHFIAGQLHHARAMCAVLAPLVNSYKRLVPGFEAPALINWGRISREALIRVPATLGDRDEDVRIEMRCADPSCNPYLAFAVMLHTALDGIQQELDPGPTTEETLMHMDEQALLRRSQGRLPSTLGDALADLVRDEFVMKALGEHAAAVFIEAKSREWTEYTRQVHEWELDQFLLA